MQQTAIPTLYHLSSSQSLRVLWALEELKEAHNLQYHVKKYTRAGSRAPDELKKVHPLGKSPILTIGPLDNPLASEGPSQQPSEATATTTPPQTEPLKTLSESRLILLFISENYASGLWTPKSAESRDRDLFFQEYANSTLRSKMDLTMIFEIVAAFAPFFVRPLIKLMTKPIVAAMSADHGPLFQLLEDALSSEQPWFAGERIGLADFNMIFGMDVAEQRGYFDKSKFPKLAKWLQTVHERPAYKAAVAMGPTYDLVNFT